MENFEDIEEYFDQLDELVDAQPIRIPKRYIRDMENPIDFFNDVEFKKRYRFSKPTIIDGLLPLVINDLQKQSNRGLPVVPLLQLLTCLRFYATSNFQMVCGDLRGISQSTVSGIIVRVSQIFSNNMLRYVHFPNTANEHRANMQMFYQVGNFPRVSGCIDCTHIKVKNYGGENAEVFRNRKGFFSINVQAVAGPRGQILDLVANSPGSCHDSVIFQRSAVNIRYQDGLLPGLLLGDNGYACRQYLLTPVVQPDTDAERRYNAAHIRTRNIVERMFGIWKRRFPCLHRGLLTKLETSLLIINATALLHNISIMHNDVLNENEHFEPEDIQQVNEPQLVQGLQYRRLFIEENFNF